jgi:repressor LexA
MKELTERQREVLIFITEYIDIHNYPPTIREIAEYFAVSVKGAYDHVTALRKKGRIRSDKRSRTMELVNPAKKRDADALVEVPLLGTVAAGAPILAEENWDGVIPVHRSMLKKDGDYFAVTVRGASMEGAGIMDGDTAVIRKQEVVHNGEIAVVIIGDEAMTLKRFYQEKNRVRLQPENADFQPIFSRDVRVLGKVVHVFRSY